MSVLISTDLQLLTYTHERNIDKNLLFNYSPYFDLRFITNNVGNTMYSRGNTEIKLLISLSAGSSVKVKGLNTSASKHIALDFLVAVVTSCCNTYNFGICKMKHLRQDRQCHQTTGQDHLTPSFVPSPFLQ